MFKNKNKFFKSVLLLLIVSVLLSQHINLSNVFGEEEEYSFTLAVLPDTQKYSAGYPVLFNQQTQWIVDNKENLNIIFVSHLGDLIQHFDPRIPFHVTRKGAAIDVDIAWQNAVEAMSKLDAVIPYAVLPGNHDFDYNNDVFGVANKYNKYFPVSKYENEEWWGGNYLGNKNSFQLFSFGDLNFLIFHIEFSPTEDVLEWVNEVLESYPDRRVIISTHQYLDSSNGQRVGVSENKARFTREGGNSGEDIWQKSVKSNCNIFMVLSGHWHGEAMQTSINDCGNFVFEIVQDYTFRENGGDGWLRYFVFKPLEDKIYAFTYSPYLDEFEKDEDSEFVLDYEM